MIGAEHVAKSEPDGYTLLRYTQTMLVNAHIYSKTPYDALKSFVGITPLTRLVSMMAVHHHAGSGNRFANQMGSRAGDRGIVGNANDSISGHPVNRGNG